MLRFSIIFAALLPLLFRSASLAEEAVPASLEEVLRLASERNPEILAARDAWRAAEARVRPAGTWPDPVLSFSREKPPSGGRMTRSSVEQEVPFPGKLSREADMARHEALAAQARSRAKELAVRAQARALYYKLFRADRLTALLDRNVEAVVSVLRAMESRLAAGRPSGMGGSAVSGADVFSMRTELGRMENMLLEEKAGRRMAAIGLNSLLDRPVDAPLSAPAAPVLRKIPLSLEEVVALADRNEPMSQAALHGSDHARAAVSLARRNFLPDFSLMYERQAGEGGMTGHEAGVGLRAPLWFSRPAGGLAEARSHAGAMQAEARAMRNEARRMAAMEYTETELHRAMAANYEKDIVPLAESALRLSRRQYESGGGDFIRLLESMRALLSAERERYDQLYHYGEHWGLLEQWAGTALEAGLGSGNQEENTYEE